MAGSALFFSVMSMLVKVAAERGLPPMEIVLVRCAVMTVFTAGLARAAGVSIAGNARRTLFGRGLVGATALSLFYFALGRLPLGDATALHYTAPMWTAALAGPLLGERAGRPLLGALLLSGAGVVLVTRPAFVFGGAALDTWGVAAALGGAILSGLAYVSVRRLRDTDHPLTVVFWLSWVGVAIALPFAALEWVRPAPVDWLILVAVGLTTQVAQVLMTRGLHLETAGRAVGVGYLQVVFAFGWGWLIFGAEPTAIGLVGAAFVVVSTLLLGVARR
jgi:drug/metabolite transporter (DMT)-like permease